MSLISCPECTSPVSDKAPHCPKCGVRISGGIGGVKKAVTATISTTVDKVIGPPVKLDAVMQYVDTSKKPESCRTVNGIGSTFGGYFPLSGCPGYGFIKKYYTALYIPAAPSATYLVKDWDGTQGYFIGEISADNAARFVSRKKQAASVAGATVVNILLFIFALFVMALVSMAIRSIR